MQIFIVVFIMIIFKFMHFYSLNKSPLVYYHYLASQLSFDLIFLASNHSNPCSATTRTFYASGFLVKFPYAKPEFNMKILSLELHSQQNHVLDRDRVGLEDFPGTFRFGIPRVYELPEESGNVLFWILYPSVISVILPSFPKILSTSDLNFFQLYSSKKQK